VELEGTSLPTLAALKCVKSEEEEGGGRPPRDDLGVGKTYGKQKKMLFFSTFRLAKSLYRR
jgi:hypothetical protein